MDGVKPKALISARPKRDEKIYVKHFVVSLVIKLNNTRHLINMSQIELIASARDRRARNEFQFYIASTSLSVYAYN